MRNELAARAEMEAAEAWEAAQEQEFLDRGLSKFMPEPIQAGKLRPHTPCFTWDQVADALLAVSKS